MLASLRPLFLSFIFILFPALSIGADFTVNPVRIFFDGAKKTEVIKIKNNSAESITLQVSILAWEQDQEGEDAYSPTEDIIIFPKIFSIKSGEERIMRVGTRVPPSQKEKAYRVYVEEVPGPDSAATGETVLRTLMRVGVPVFVSPIEAKASGEIEGALVKGGNLAFKVTNTGNTHFIIRSVRIKGKDARGDASYQAELAGRYLHGGHSKSFSVNIPEEDCLRVKHIEVDVETDRLSMEERLDVLPEACSP